MAVQGPPVQGLTETGHQSSWEKCYNPRQRAVPASLQMLQNPVAMHDGFTGNMSKSVINPVTESCCNAQELRRRAARVPYPLVPERDVARALVGVDCSNQPWTNNPTSSHRVTTDFPTE